MTLRFQVADLLASPGEARADSARMALTIELANASVDGEIEVELKLRSLSDGIVVRGDISTEADLVCNRCLQRWTRAISVPFEQIYRLHPEDEDDELPIVDRAWIDLESVVHDELSLGLPLAPLCKEDCQGLCPTCGTDLNVQPCGGHGEEFNSPFASLKDLFDS
jgi:uncharacterized protein